ncbi:MAG: response regulator, partial [Bacteroidota bacterium]|nr:response regulator [Bacteroidota bacterium]
MELKKILLVDDSQPFNFLTRLVLTQNGVNCKIDEALNGKTALDYINKSAECPDIILLDINMPVMDGFEFLAEFKKLSKCANTRIYILTSSN